MEKGARIIMYCIISDEKKFIIGWSAKCGCTSLKKWFLEEHNIEYIDKNGIFWHNQIIGYGDTPFSKICSPEKYDDYKKIWVIRDPYKRIKSSYISVFVKYPKPGYEWMNHISKFIDTIYPNRFNSISQWKHHYVPQTSEDYQKTINFKWDKVLLTTDLIKEWPNINDFLGTTKMIGHHNIVDYAKYPVELTEELAKKIEIIYKKDFEVFKHLGYEFNWRKELDL